MYTAEDVWVAAETAGHLPCIVRTCGMDMRIAADEIKRTRNICLA